MAFRTGTLLTMFRAVAEQTRLRIVALLQHGELTVSDLTDILGQSQPRISRHLKLLTEAGIVDKHREGTFVFFELVADGPTGELVADLLRHIDSHDPALAADLDRLGVVRGRRAAAAQEYFAAIAGRWDQQRLLHAPDTTVESHMIKLLEGTGYQSVLDLGTGTGRMLQVLAQHATSAARPVRRLVGLDNSHSMLAVARANLERGEVRRVELRQGDVYSPPFEAGSFDLIMIHQVLHFLDDPARAVREASRLLAPKGRLVIVDFAPHALEFLRTDHAHRRLGFRSDTIESWLEPCGLEISATAIVDPPSTGSDELLTVSLWLATERVSTSTAIAHEEVAS